MLKPIIKLIHFVYLHKQYGLSLRLGLRLGQFLCCQTCLVIPKVNCITLLPTARREREMVACYGKHEKGLSLTSGDCQ